MFSAAAWGETVNTIDETLKIDGGTAAVAVNVDQDKNSWDSSLTIEKISEKASKETGLVGFYQSSLDATIDGSLTISNISLEDRLWNGSVVPVAGVRVDNGTLSGNGKITVSQLIHKASYELYTNQYLSANAYVAGVSLTNASINGFSEILVEDVSTNLVDKGSTYGVNLQNVASAEGLSTITVRRLTAESGRSGKDAAPVVALNIEDSKLGTKDNPLNVVLDTITTTSGDVNGVRMKDSEVFFGNVEIDGLHRTGSGTDNRQEIFGFHLAAGSEESDHTQATVQGKLYVNNLTVQYGNRADVAGVMVGKSIENDTDFSKGSATLTAGDILVQNITVKSTGANHFRGSGVAVGEGGTLNADTVTVSGIKFHQSPGYIGNAFYTGFSACNGKVDVGSLTIEGVENTNDSNSEDTYGLLNLESDIRVGALTVKGLKGNSGVGVQLGAQRYSDPENTKLTVGDLTISNTQNLDDFVGLSVYEGLTTISESASITAGNGNVAVSISKNGEVQSQGTSFWAEGDVTVRGTLLLDAAQTTITGAVRAEDANARITSQGGSTLTVTHIAEPLVWNPIEEEGYEGLGTWLPSGPNASLNLDALFAGDEEELWIAPEGQEPAESALIDWDRSATIRAQESDEYQGTESASERSFVYGAAVRANAGGKIALDNAGSHYAIFGNVVAGNGNYLLGLPEGETTLDQYFEMGYELVGGNISLGGKDLRLVGDVFAANNGKISLDLNGNAYFEGRADDYHELNDELKGTVFHNTAFVSQSCMQENGNTIYTAGDISITMSDSATWVARGESFVNKLNFTEGFSGAVDLSRDENSSLIVGTLSGDGRFVMRLNADPEKSDMLYVRNLEQGASYVIDVAEAVTRDGTLRSYEDLHGLRIATSANGEADFKVAIRNGGVNDVMLAVTSEDYDVNDEDNVLFNGEGNGEDVWKPGNDAVNEVYKDGKNWVIDAKSGDSQTTLSDAGEVLLATAKAAYWTAVEIDRFGNRAGDVRYVEGDEGAWMRVRHSRMGTDDGIGDFRSESTMYQIGFDHAFALANGKQRFGLAFDYFDSDLDYRTIKGEGEADRYALTAYATWLGDNGGYVDLVGKYGVLDNDFTISNSSGTQVKADYQNHIVGLSVEAGHRLSNATGMFIEPNVQLQYVRISDADYRTNQKTRIDQDAVDSIISRVGFRVGTTFGETDRNTFYAKADWFHEYRGEQKFKFRDVTTAANGDDLTVQNKGNWFDAGFGVQASFGNNAYGFADVEYRFGNDLERTWIFNVGGRLAF